MFKRETLARAYETLQSAVALYFGDTKLHTFLSGMRGRGQGCLMSNPLTQLVQSNWNMANGQVVKGNGTTGASALCAALFGQAASPVDASGAPLYTPEVCELILADVLRSRVMPSNLLVVSVLTVAALGNDGIDKLLAPVFEDTEEGRKQALAFRKWIVYSAKTFSSMLEKIETPAAKRATRGKESYTRISALYGERD